LFVLLGDVLNIYRNAITGMAITNSRIKIDAPNASIAKSNPMDII